MLVLLLALAGVIYLAYRKISGTVKSYSRMIFGTEDVLKGVQQMEAEYAKTPKSVSSATGLYLPGIMKDFPEFHLEEMKSRAQNVLTSYLFLLFFRSCRQSTSTLRTNLQRYTRSALTVIPRFRAKTPAPAGSGPTDHAAVSPYAVPGSGMDLQLRQKGQYGKVL